MLTIKEGFTHLTDQEGWHHKCTNKDKPLNPNTARSFKRIFKTGKLSEAKMIELLKSAGYTIIPPKCKLPQQNETTQRK